MLCAAAGRPAADAAAVSLLLACGACVMRVMLGNSVRRPAPSCVVVFHAPQQQLTTTLPPPHPTQFTYNFVAGEEGIPSFNREMGELADTFKQVGGECLWVRPGSPSPPHCTRPACCVARAHAPHPAGAHGSVARLSAPECVWRGCSRAG